MRTSIIVTISRPNAGIEKIAKHVPGGPNQPDIIVTNVGVIIQRNGESISQSRLIPWHRVVEIEYFDHDGTQINKDGNVWEVK